MHNCSMGVKGVRTYRQNDTVDGPEEPMDLVFTLIKSAQHGSSDQLSKTTQASLVVSMHRELLTGLGLLCHPLTQST